MTDAITVTEAGLAALAMPVTLEERLHGLLHAITDLKGALPIYARTGKLEIATTLLGELAEEVTEIAEALGGATA